MQCSDNSDCYHSKFGSVQEQFNFLEKSESLVKLSPVLVAEGEWSQNHHCGSGAACSNGHVNVLNEAVQIVFQNIMSWSGSQMLLLQNWHICESLQ